MEITITKNNLVNSLQKIQYILEKTSALQHSHNILFTTNESTAFITAYDIDCSARATVPITLSKPGTICVNGKKLFEIIKSFDDEDILLQKNSDDNLVTIKGKKSFFHIVSANPEDFPVIDFTSPDEHFYLQAETVKKIIDRTVFSVARIPDPRYNLEGVYVELTPQEKESADDDEKNMLAFIATDGHRVTVAKTDKVGGQITLGERRIFSRKSLVEIKNVFADSETLKMSFAGNDVHVRGENFILILRMLKGSFPDYRKMIPTSFIHEITINKDALLQILRRMNILAHDKYKGIAMHFATDNLTVSINNPEMGHAREDMAINYAGEPVNVSFNIRYLLDFLQVVATTDIDIMMSSGMHPCILKEHGSDNFINGIMPMKS
ncbi:MAG: DNA polymerase III subunit beta [Deltaproteobacteria bacterium]|nr:DNA polymerase III subunit beta [Candidatus Anaeroferrophillus wilburensis]MBN2889178.1 DNA polymerase III subunit beta [Deltaproteobacteria bacterium]